MQAYDLIIDTGNSMCELYELGTALFMGELAPEAYAEACREITRRMIERCET